MRSPEHRSRNSRPSKRHFGSSGPRVSSAMTIYAARCRRILKGRHGWLPCYGRRGYVIEPAALLHPNGWVTMSSSHQRSWCLALSCPLSKPGQDVRALRLVDADGDRLPFGCLCARPVILCIMWRTLMWRVTNRWNSTATSSSLGWRAVMPR